MILWLALDQSGEKKKFTAQKKITFFSTQWGRSFKNPKKAKNYFFFNAVGTKKIVNKKNNNLAQKITH
jgi:hypothetical protein